MANQPVLAEIQTLLAESVAHAADREQAHFSRELHGSDGSVVLLGAGRLGRLCARALRRAKIPLRAFCDRNEALHGSVIEGATVLAPAIAAEKYGRDSAFVVAIWTGTARETMTARLRYLQELGCRQVTGYPALVWAHGAEECPFHSFDLPSRILAHAPELRRLASLLGDELSLATFATTLRQRLHGRFGPDVPPAPDQYFPGDLPAPGPRELVIDGGAYTGDTLAAFLERTGGALAHYHAFEPDRVNVAALQRRVQVLPAEIRGRITVHETALHDRAGSLRFGHEGGLHSRVDGGTSPVNAVSLDELLPDVPVTFLKLDVEGAEQPALQGAENLLRRAQPRVAVCIYHRPRDLWEIPLFLHRLLPHHRIYFRPHGIDGWELVSYHLPVVPRQ